MFVPVGDVPGLEQRAMQRCYRARCRVVGFIVESLGIYCRG